MAEPRNIAAKCSECHKWMSMRPAAYYEQLHEGDRLVCAQCRRIIKPKALATIAVTVPCGTIRAAKAMTRCAGFLPVGEEDGCIHYEHCMDLAAKCQWEGFYATSGRRDTSQWKYVDDFAEFFESNIYLGCKLGYKCGEKT